MRASGTSLIGAWSELSVAWDSATWNKISINVDSFEKWVDSYNLCVVRWIFWLGGWRASWKTWLNRDVAVARVPYRDMLCTVCTFSSTLRRLGIPYLYTVSPHWKTKNRFFYSYFFIYWAGCRNFILPWRGGNFFRKPAGKIIPGQTGYDSLSGTLV